MYQINSAVKEWYEKCDGLGVPCVHCEAQMEDIGEAIEFAKKLAAERPDEVFEVRVEECVWFSELNI